jgi:hypothetical protein
MVISMSVLVRIANGRPESPSVAARRALFLALLLLSPVLIGCSSSASQHDSAVTSSYPQQLRTELPRPAQAVAPDAMQNVSAAAPRGPIAGTALAGLSPPRSASSPAPTAAPTFAPAQTTLSAATGQPTSLSPPVAANGAATSPATSSAPDDFDAAASAYPSVALFDLIRQSQNSTSQARPANPPLVSDSVTPQPATGQPAAAPPAAQPATATAAAAAPAASSSDDNFDAAASAYPSVPLFGHSQ